MIADSTYTGTSLPTVLPEVASLLKHDGACRERCFRGREAKTELFESNSLVILDVHFQGIIQRTNHANPNPREISLGFFIWCSETQPTIHTTNIPEVTKGIVDLQAMHIGLLETPHCEMIINQ